MQQQLHAIFNRSIAQCFVLFISLLSLTNAAKILAVFPHASESHFVAMRTFLMEMAKREHNITLYSSHRLDERLDNLKEHIIEPEFQFWKEVQKQAGSTNLQGLSSLSDENLNKYLAKAGLTFMDYFLANQKMQNLLNISPDDFDYDLIIVDIFYTEALLALGYHFTCPVVGVVNTDFANYMHQVQEMMVPAACLPYNLENYDKNLGYWERLSNIELCLTKRNSFIYDHYVNQEKVIKKYFKQRTDSIPSIRELQSNLALLLINNYYPLATPMPLVPNVIPVGGLHIRAPKDLPWHIRRFLDESPSGVIYMNLGDEKLCNDISNDKLDVLIHVFSQRKERILWTCHDVKKLEGQPKNVMIQHLVPQTDILAHPHIRLFITNGDIMSLQEGIVRHVPLLVMPLFKNELSNSLQVEKLQIGLRLDYTNLTQTSLDWALETILHKEFYVLNIRDVSKIYRDRPLGGLASAIFWLDYIQRYGNGPLKTQGIDIPIDQLHLSDLRLHSYIWTITYLGLLIGLYFLGMFLWKKQQNHKMFSKLN